MLNQNTSSLFSIRSCSQYRYMNVMGTKWVVLALEFSVLFKMITCFPKQVLIRVPLVPVQNLHPLLLHLGLKQLQGSTMRYFLLYQGRFHCLAFFLLQPEESTEEVLQLEAPLNFLFSLFSWESRSDGGFIAVGPRQRNPEECKHGSGRGGDKDTQAPGDELHHWKESWAILQYILESMNKNVLTITLNMYNR